MEPTLEQIAEAVNGKISRDGNSVVVGYGSLGFYRLTPSEIISRGERKPAAAIDGKLNRQDGKHSGDVRKMLRDAGIEVR